MKTHAIAPLCAAVMLALAGCATSQNPAQTTPPASSDAKQASPGQDKTEKDTVAEDEPRPASSLLLAGDRLGLALTGARIGVRALAADRQALAMAEATIAGEVHQTLDVHRGLATQIAFHGVTGVDRLTDLQHFLVGQVLHAASRREAELGGDFLGLGRANAMNVGQRDFDALVGRDVDTRNTSHCVLLLLHRAPRVLNRSQ